MLCLRQKHDPCNLSAKQEQLCYIMQKLLPDDHSVILDFSLPCELNPNIQREVNTIIVYLCIDYTPTQSWITDISAFQAHRPLSFSELNTVT